MPKPKTVIEALEATSAAHGALPAMRYKTDGKWEAITWYEYRDQIRRVAKGLMSLGIEAGDCAVILADNGPRWFAAHFGSIAAGAIPAGLYTNDTPEQSRFIVEHCEAVVAFVGNAEFLEEILGIRHRLPRLRAFVLMAGDHEDDDVHSWSDLQEAGQQTSDDAYRRRRGSLDPGKRLAS